jgi:hypothetical protein
VQWTSLGPPSCQVVKQEQTSILGIIFIFVIGFLMMRIEVTQQTLVCLAFNHMRWLVAQESFISISLPSVPQQAPAAMFSAEYKTTPMVPGKGAPSTFPTGVCMERGALSPEPMVYSFFCICQSPQKGALPWNVGKTYGHCPQSPTQTEGSHTVGCSLVPQGDH